MADQATIPLYQLGIIGAVAIVGLAVLILFAAFLPDLARLCGRLSRVVRRAWR